MNNPWRVNPKLKDKFHPEYPDDIEAIVHEGFRVSDSKPEQMWIRVQEFDGSIFKAILLNQPFQLKNLKQGDKCLFILEPKLGVLVRVTTEYLNDIKMWEITPCDKCSNSTLFDPPSRIMHAAFPGLPEGATTEGFTTFCPFCGGVIIVKNVGLQVNKKVKKKRWYEFWK